MTENSKSEGLTKQFRRTLSRLRRAWKGQEIQLEDINTIKLPAVSHNYMYGDEYSYFATRTAEGKWNIDGQSNWGGEYLHTPSIAKNLDLPAALDQLAELAPESMKRNTNKYWHPVYVAGLIDHAFPPEKQARAKPKMSA